MKPLRKNFAAAAGLAAAALPLLLLAAGCASVRTESKLYPGVPGSPFPATDPSHVEVLFEPPKKADAVRIGEVIVRPAGEPTVGEIEEGVRIETAKIGGQAAVVVADGTRTLGDVAPGSWWEGAAGKPETSAGRAVVAVAIRYKE